MLGTALPAQAESVAADTPPPVFIPQEEAPAPGQPISIGSSKEDAEVIGVTGDEQGITPYLLDPIDLAQCLTFDNANHGITNYNVYRFDRPNGSPWIAAGSLQLLCGTATTSGWKHIQSRHQYSTSFHPHAWESIRSQAISIGATPSIQWDDYMDHAVQDSLDYPMPVPVDVGNDKACFSTLFHIWVGSEVYASWFVNSIVSVNNRLVITAYPSDDIFSSDCNP